MTEVKDLRKVKLYLNPEHALQFGWIPEDVRQLIVNVTDEGEPVGELEMGSDGFVKLLINMPTEGKYSLMEIEFIPGQNRAKISYK